MRLWGKCKSSSHCANYTFNVFGNMLLKPFFPIIFLFIKLTACLTNSIEWNKLNKRLTYLEGKFEAGFQLGLQFFIVFNRADRTPSPIQIVCMITSFLSIVSASLDGYFWNQPETTWKEKIKRSPVYIFGTLFDIGSVAIIALLLRYMLIFPILFIVTFGNVVHYCIKYFSTSATQTDVVFYQRYYSMVLSMIRLLVLYGLLLAFLYLANFYPEISLHNSPPFIANILNVRPKLHIDDLFIVQEIVYLNIICGVVMVSGIINIFLKFLYGKYDIRSEIINVKNDVRDFQDDDLKYN